MKLPLDRLDVAIEMCRGKRVLDIGCARMEPNNTTHPFDKKYLKIQEAAKEYCIVDISPTADIVLDLSNMDQALWLSARIKKFKPDVILCMETLEHLNHSGIVKDAIADGIEDGAEALLSIPNNQNVFVLVLSWTRGWMKHHLAAFTRTTARNYIHWSKLGKFNIVEFDAIGKYSWTWPLVWVLSGFQGFSFGYVIRKQ